MSSLDSQYFLTLSHPSIPFEWYTHTHPLRRNNLFEEFCSVRFCVITHAAIQVKRNVSLLSVDGTNSERSLNTSHFSESPRTLKTTKCEHTFPEFWASHVHWAITGLYTVHQSAAVSMLRENELSNEYRLRIVRCWLKHPHLFWIRPIFDAQRGQLCLCSNRFSKHIKFDILPIWLIGMQFPQQRGLHYWEHTQKKETPKVYTQIGATKVYTKRHPKVYRKNKSVHRNQSHFRWKPKPVWLLTKLRCPFYLCTLLGVRFFV